MNVVEIIIHLPKVDQSFHHRNNLEEKQQKCIKRTLVCASDYYCLGKLPVQ